MLLQLPQRAVWGAAARLRAYAALHLVPLVLIATAAAWVAAAAAALCCRLRVERRQAGPYVLVYKNVLGGYHPNSDIDDAWRQLEAAARAAAPEVMWSKLPTFRLAFDDQFAIPFGESCRSSIGWVVSAGCADPEAEAAWWRAHAAATAGALRVGVLPRGACYAAALPHCGPLSHGVALARVVPRFLAMARQGQVRTKVPGVMQICDPTRRRILFVCPLEARTDMLPFHPNAALQ